MRKLISLTVVALFAWAALAFAWAALSHVTGLPGPARASAASLELAADAVTLADPPGVLGAPQRFAAGQLRAAGGAAYRLHRGPERAMARLLDRLGHDHGHRHRHVLVERHVEPRVAPRMELRGPDVYFHVPLELEGRNRIRERLRPHRWDLGRQRLEFDRLRSGLERERAAYERQHERLERSIERLSERWEDARARSDGEAGRRLQERLREILRRLEDELEDLEDRMDEAVGQAIEGALEDGVLEIDAVGEAGSAPVIIRLRDR